MYLRDAFLDQRCCQMCKFTASAYELSTFDLCQKLYQVSLEASFAKRKWKAMVFLPQTTTCPCVVVAVQGQYCRLE
jgi:hypothetical protein